jgi:hypothetical protein
VNPKGLTKTVAVRPLLRAENLNFKGEVSMPTAMALTIGLNSVDPKHYAGWSGPLAACEADALDMADIAKAKKMKTETLLTKSATRAKVLGGIRKATKALKSGDLFLLSYSGHGGQVPDKNADEADHEDETWCLFDGELLDDELNAELASFAPGVRVLVFSDSCHSGTVTKVAFYQALRSASVSPLSDEPLRYRAMPPDVALATYRRNRKFYDDLQKSPGSKKGLRDVGATVLLISGCQDNQLSSDGTFNGLFTGTMLRVWNDGKFKGNYKQFLSGILKSMPPAQTPNYFLVGAANGVFEKQTPFTV